MKCKYCDKEATWLNHYNNSYYCDEHANDKVKQLMLELDESSNTCKDWFEKIYESDPNKVNFTFKKSKWGKKEDANNSRRQTDF